MIRRQIADRLQSRGMPKLDKMAETIGQIEERLGIFSPFYFGRRFISEHASGKGLTRRLSPVFIGDMFWLH
jgi:hypothetical protein